MDTIKTKSVPSSTIETLQPSPSSTENEPMAPYAGAAVGGESAMLVLQRGGEAGRSWPLNRTSEISIGRSEDCDISLPDRQVSRYHAHISWQGNQYQIEDLGSKNGTHVNGQEVQSTMSLQDGDEVQIALRFKMAFVDAGATAPLTFSAVKHGLNLDGEAREVTVNGETIDPPLSLHQYRLLESLWGAEGGIVTRQQIVDTVWPEASGEGVSEQAIDALVRRLRERIAEFDDGFRYIITVRGHGFRLVNQ